MSLNASRSEGSMSPKDQEARDEHCSGVVLQEGDEEPSTDELVTPQTHKTKFTYPLSFQGPQQSAQCIRQLLNMSKPPTNLKDFALSRKSSTCRSPPTLHRYKSRERSVHSMELS